MSFPNGATDGQLYTTALGTLYQYSAARTAWLILGGGTIGPAGQTGVMGQTGLMFAPVTGIQGQTGVQGSQGNPGSAPIAFVLFPDSVACYAATGTVGVIIPAGMTGKQLSEVMFGTDTPGTGGSMTANVRKASSGTHVNMLTSDISLSSGSYKTNSASISSSNKTIAGGDMVFVDITGVNTTPANGASLTMMFQ